MSLFFVTSRGLTATTWFSNALNANQHTFCSHGRDRPSRGIETDSLLLDENYRIDRLNYEQWQRKASIDDYIVDLVGASNGESCVGNVHGYVLIEIMDKLSKLKNDDIVVANMIRNPLGFVESYTSLVNHRKIDYPEKFYAEHDNRVQGNKKFFDKYKINHKDIEMTGFFEACQSLKKSANEMKMFPVFTVKMEELVSSEEYFLNVFSFLTKGLLHYDAHKLANIVKINSHQKKFKKKLNTANTADINRCIWNNWTSKKRYIFLDFMSKECIDVYKEYDYDLSYII